MTVLRLLSKGVYINLCLKRGIGPFFIARPNRDDSTVAPLLSKGTDINQSEEKMSVFSM